MCTDVMVKAKALILHERFNQTLFREINKENCKIKKTNCSNPLRLNFCSKLLTEIVYICVFLYVGQCVDAGLCECVSLFILNLTVVVTPFSWTLLGDALRGEDHVQVVSIDGVPTDIYNDFIYVTIGNFIVNLNMTPLLL